MISLLFAVMQEQLAVFSFLYFFMMLTFDYFNKKLIGMRKYSLAIIVSFIGILSAKFSPENAIRLESEVNSWFPTFKEVGLLNRIGLAFTDTNYYLFAKPLLFILFFVILIILISIFKKKIIATVLGIFILINMFSASINLPSLYRPLRAWAEHFMQTHELSPFLNTLFITSISIITLLAIIFIIWSISNETKFFITNTFILAIGYIGRMLISFSPTMYASGIRTLMPIMLAIFIVSINLIEQETKRRIS